ncbi:type VI secretion system ImpA family N-terminal domain-containing protein, partial [Serratia ureilytica]
MKEQYGIEFEPSYCELEFVLSEYDSQTDPLNTLDIVNDINWNVICDKARELLEHCFDLRVILWLMRANLHIDGFSAFYQGIKDIDAKYAEEG